MKIKHIITLCLVTLFPLQSNALSPFRQTHLIDKFFSVIDDSELSPKVVRIENVPSVLAPDKTSTSVLSTGQTELQVFRMIDNQKTEIKGLPIQLTSCKGNQDISVQMTLKHTHFSVESAGMFSSKPYSIKGTVKCGNLNEWIFEKDSNGGQALGIWQVAFLAYTRLSQTVDMAFWSQPIQFMWPESADYYSFGSVHITLGHQWDVVGHEMGHAIYDQAGIGASEGGTHKIDECYGETLAYSEGWASYFSAWVQIGLSDPDAKFQYMVPRRAPIQIENVPTDVCQGARNEWRTTAFLWDVIDTNDDGETSEEEFKTVWDILKNQGSSSVKEVKDLLLNSGMDAQKIKDAWKTSLVID